MTGAQILRDYLYLDVDKVKSIAGQLEYGVPEETRLTERNVKRGNVGWSAVLSFSPESGEENLVSRSTLDSLFPELEEALEADGWLLDISDIFNQDQNGPFASVKDARPDASIFRVTASGFLFDSRYLASVMAGFSASVAGLIEMGESQSENIAPVKFNRKSTTNRNAQSRKQVPIPDTPEKLENYIEEFGTFEGISTAYLRSIMRVSRGLYRPGPNLVLFSSPHQGAMTINARLQENRRYLDADPDTIGSRFGMRPQQWTIVGTVGHYSDEEDQVETSQDNPSSESNEQHFDRHGFIKLTNSVIQKMGTAGLTDLPQHPGMSAIPIAVYRTAFRNVASEIDVPKR